MGVEQHENAKVLLIIGVTHFPRQILKDKKIDRGILPFILFSYLGQKKSFS
jgi:hypothetical protein